MIINSAKTNCKKAADPFLNLRFKSQTPTLCEERMQGNILTYSEESDEGIITGPGGSRYKFSKADWKENCPVISRVNVDFVTEGERATEIYCTDTDAMTAALKSIEAAKAAKVAHEEALKQKEIIKKLEIDYSGYYRSSDKMIWKGVCAGLSHKTGIPLVIVRALFIYPGFFLLPIYYFRWSKWKERPTNNVYSVGADKFADKVNSAALIMGALAGKGPNGENLNAANTIKETRPTSVARTEPQRVLSNVLACGHCGASTSVSSQSSSLKCPACNRTTYITYREDGTILFTT